MEQEIIGVDPEGKCLLYVEGKVVQSEDGLDDIYRSLNQREHMATHPMEYLIVTRMRIELALKKKSWKTARKSLEECLDQDPDRTVNELSYTARYIREKEQLKSKQA